jgi:hypothetical protein
VAFDLYGDDWKLPAGHRVGVLLSASNAEWWLHRPTLQPVTVGSASISLPWRGCSDGDRPAGPGAPRAALAVSAGARFSARPAQAPREFSDRRR